MTGHDVFRWHWALHLLCHWTVWFRNKVFFFSLESSFFAERFTDILGFSQCKVKWSNKCMNISAVFSVCKTKNSLQAHHTCKIPCHSKAPGEIMKHEKPSRQNLRLDLLTCPEQCAEGAQVCCSGTCCAVACYRWVRGQTRNFGQVTS